jgi:hypothetical protein
MSAGSGTGGISAGSWIAGTSEGSVTVGIAEGNWTAGMSLGSWTAGTSAGKGNGGCSRAAAGRAAAGPRYLTAAGSWAAQVDLAVPQKLVLVRRSRHIGRTRPQRAAAHRCLYAT